MTLSITSNIVISHDPSFYQLEDTFLDRLWVWRSTTIGDQHEDLTEENFDEIDNQAKLESSADLVKELREIIQVQGKISEEIYHQSVTHDYIVRRHGIEHVQEFTRISLNK